jgi:UDP-3-O-[3-hydroxymyristoyl] glucosamine N-acyltransferase
MGGQAGVADHITIGDRASISAQAGVMADVAPGEAVYGTPALPGATAKRLHFYSLRLGELFQQLKQLQRRMEELEGQEKRP